jgi:precorrin-3B C17-methyltransferase
MRKRGSLCVVGLGPGERAMMTGQAQTAVQHADVVIGYEGYFTWVVDLVAGKECVALPLTQEVARAQLAVDRALAGQSVCVISSGDAGIYGMASVVLELLAAQQGDTVGPEVMVIPGVSAVNACASLVGAPIGHDFAVMSLSDLLTPWELIEKRLTATAAADFVMVLLNPKSLRRHWQYGRAQAIIAQYRAPETPVGIVRNAYRPDQSIDIVTVADMATAHVDMLTTVIIGNSQTRLLQSRMVTPRGYAVVEGVEGHAS